MKFELQETAHTPQNLVDFIAQHCDASKSQIKKALNLGGGWIKKKGQKSKKRCRRAKAMLRAGDHVSFYFDSRLLALTHPTAVLIEENKNWGVWYKPAGVPSQGTLHGDVGCMLEQVSALRNGRETFLVHRLDTETAGIMLFAYSQNAAARLSALWQTQEVTKTYQAEVKGKPTAQSGVIELPLDGKSAKTIYSVQKELEETSLLQIKIETGRYHQIRRHLESLGHPVMGDPKYGTGNKNKSGLKLVANQLNFTCPFSNQVIHVELDTNYSLF